jgi:hypothetical protein
MGDENNKKAKLPDLKVTGLFCFEAEAKECGVRSMRCIKEERCYLEPAETFLNGSQSI